MSIIYIKYKSPTITLKSEKMSSDKWYSQKTDVSHFQILGYTV
jgi:hypothetical protein